MDPRGVGPSGRYRLRCVVASLWQPARVPADLRGLEIDGTHVSRVTQIGSIWVSTPGTAHG